MKKSVVRKFTGIFLLVSVTAMAPVSLAALTVEKGRLSLTLHENNGRFSLSYLEDMKKDRYVPLFFERDPRTSSLGLLVDNKIITLGPTSRFEQTAERTVDGARFIWLSSKLRVTQTFRFIKSRPNGLVDGVEITVHIRNDGKSLSSIGVHMLIDTDLAESKDVHFVTSEGEEIDGETELSGAMPEHWISPSKSDEFRGLQGQLTGPGITRPERVIFANWKRLNDELWNLEVRSNRNFNLPPYSIGDSAVCQFYEVQRLSSGESMKISFALGAATGGSFSAGTSSSAAADSGKKDGASMEEVRKSISSTSSQKGKTLEEDLIAVNDIISNIDSLIENPSQISDEKIDMLEEALSTLQERKGSYSESGQ